MYLFLGQNTVIREKDIVGVFDLDNTSQSYLTREYLARAEKSGLVINIAEDIPKSFVVCSGEDDLVYLSQLASSTLLKRSENNIFL